MYRKITNKPYKMNPWKLKLHKFLSKSISIWVLTALKRFQQAFECGKHTKAVWNTQQILHRFKCRIKAFIRTNRACVNSILWQSQLSGEYFFNKMTIVNLYRLKKFVFFCLLFLPSRGGLEVERWSDNKLHSASVGSNPV